MFRKTSSTFVRGFACKKACDPCAVEKMKKFFVGGNWKMNGDKQSIRKLVQALRVDKMDKDVDVCIAAPTCYLDFARSALPSRILLAAQNCYSVPKGAFTGEISPAMIKDCGATWVILGHSERRHIFCETNEMIAKKVEHALKSDVKVIYCVGETEEEREESRSEEVVMCQMTAILRCVPDWDNVVIAYEPVWAIGTGKVATPDIAQEMHCKIREFLKDQVCEEVGKSIRIIYGGSVTKENACKLSAKEDIDGFLVGGASLKEEFRDIVNSKKKTAE